MQRNVKDASKSDRSRQELSNKHLVAKFGKDTAKHESSKVCQKVFTRRQFDRLSRRTNIGQLARLLHDPQQLRLRARGREHGLAQHRAGEARAASGAGMGGS